MNIDEAKNGWPRLIERVKSLGTTKRSASKAFTLVIDLNRHISQVIDLAKESEANTTKFRGVIEKMGTAELAGRKKVAELESLSKLLGDNNRRANRVIDILLKYIEGTDANDRR